MTKRRIQTNLIGRPVRFASPSDVYRGPVDERFAEMFPPDERQMASFVPRVKEPDWPTNRRGEIVATVPYSDDSGLDIVVNLGDQTRPFPLALAEYGAIEIGPLPARDDRIADALEAIAVTLDASLGSSQVRRLLRELTESVGRIAHHS